ncbi:MAG: beta strand repeat-containing protein [Lautropia sp.]
MALFLEIRSDEAAASRIRLSAGRNRINVRPGDTYRVVDDQTGFAPAGTTVKRVDNGVVIDGLGRDQGGDEVVVDLSEFYSICSVSSPCSVVVQKEAGGAVATVTPSTQPIGALSDGSFVLYDPAYVAPAPVAVESSDGGLGRIALYALGGLAVVGLAAGGSGGGGGGDAGGPAPPDGTLRLSSSPFVNSRTPVIAGQGEPGATVTVQIDLNRDNVVDVRYQTTVAADGTWRVDLASATPSQGSLPAAGIGDNGSVLISSTRDGAPTALAPFNLVFDGTPPAPASIAAIATDNAVNGAEKQAGVTVSGTAEANGTVLVSWGGLQKVATVNAAGAWSTSFAAGEVPADGATVVTAVARDAAGNSAPAATRAVQVESQGPALSIATVAGNNVVNAAEAASVVVSGTTAPGAAVTVNWNGVAKPATAGTDGAWSVAYTGAEVPPATPATPAGTNVPLVVTATTVLGNTASAGPVQILVDRVAPAAPTIGIVEGNDVVSTLERADGVVITGTGEAGATINLNWAGAAKTGTVAGNGTWSINYAVNEVPAGPSTTVTATATDAAGNAGAATSRPVTIAQLIPPPVVAGNIATDGVVNATELAAGFTISGTVTAGAPGVNVSIAGGPANLAATVVGTNWSVVVPGGSALAQGAHAVTATIAEPGGQSGTGSFTVDTVGPTAPTIGPIATNNVVNIAEAAGGVTVSGTTEPGAALALTWGNATPQQTTANGAGAWSVLYAPGALPTVPGGVGSAALAVATTDAAGNPGASQNAVVAFDLQAPATPVITASGSTPTGIALSGTAEAGSLVSVAVGTPAGTPVTVTATGGVWSAAFAGPTSGTFQVTLSTTDAAGNPSVVGSQVVVIGPPVAHADPASDVLAHDGQDLAGALSLAAAPSSEPLAITDLLHPAASTGAPPGAASSLASAGALEPGLAPAPTPVAIVAPDAVHALDALLWHTTG